jgi:hypothetical protein
VNTKRRLPVESIRSESVGVTVSVMPATPVVLVG